MKQKYVSKQWFIAALVILLALSSSALFGQGNACDNITATEPIERGTALQACGDLQGALDQFNLALDNAADDTARAEAMTSIGGVYYDMGEFFEAQRNYENARLIYADLGDNQAVGRAYYLSAQAMNARGQTDEARAYYFQALSVSEDVGDIFNLGRTHYALGMMYYAEQKYESTLEHLNEALRLQQEDADAAAQITTLHSLSELYYDLGDLANTRTSLELLRDLSAGTDDQAENGYALLRLGILDRYIGRYTASLEQFQQAETIFDDLDLTSYLIQTKAEIGNIYRLIASYTTAHSYLDTAEFMAEENADCANLRLVYNYQGQVALAQGRNEDALALFEDSVNADCATYTEEVDAEAYHGRGSAYLELGDYTLGRDDYQRALGVYEELGLPVGRREVRVSLGRHFFSVGQFDQALDYFFTALDIAQDTADTWGVASVYMALGDFYTFRNLINQALEYYNSAFALYDELQSELGLGTALDAIGSLYYNQARYTEAINFYERALELYNTLDNVSFLARIDYNRAMIYVQYGQYDLALLRFQEAREQFASVDEQQNVLSVDIAVGQLYQRIGQFEQALELFDTVVNRGGNQYPRIVAEGSIGIADVTLLQWEQNVERLATVDPEQQNAVYDEAASNYITAYNIYLALENQTGLGVTVNRIGELLVLGYDDLGFGYEWLRVGLQINRNVGNVMEEMVSLRLIGQLYLQISSFDNAMSYLNDALELALVLDPMQAAEIITNQGYIYERQGNISMAIERYEAATEILSSIYGGLNNASWQFAFSTQQQTLLPYERLIRLYGLNTIVDNATDWERAFNYAEQSRARSFLFQLSDEQISLSSDEDTTVLQEWQTARNDLITLNNALTQVNQNVSDEVDQTDLRLQIDDAEARLEELEQGLELSSLRQITGINVADLATVQASLPPETAMVVYYVLPDVRTAARNEGGRIFTFVITSDSIHLSATLIDSYQTELVNRVSAFRRNTNSADALPPLYELLIDPIESYIEGYNNLVIVPHNVLNYLPFEALPDANGVPLITNYNISYTPSATVYTLLQAETSNRTITGTSLVLANSDNLLYAVDEANNVGQILGVDPLINEAATESAVREAIGESDVVHVVAHGIFDIQDPLSSYLLLAPDATNDGQLQVREIYSLPLEANFPLVVLSACDTAVGQLSVGDELDNMTRAFLLSGAHAVVASLWSVDDEATSQLMTSFYTYRAQGIGEVEALSQAKRDLMVEWTEPYYWAAFVLIGIDQ
jgi:CHAT domain-containing protein/Tfp pilus assembly protein PilF